MIIGRPKISFLGIGTETRGHANQKAKWRTLRGRAMTRLLSASRHWLYRSRRNKNTCVKSASKQTHEVLILFLLLLFLRFHLAEGNEGPSPLEHPLLMVICKTVVIAWFLKAVFRMLIGVF